MTISRRSVLKGGVGFAGAALLQQAPPAAKVVLLGTQGGPNYTAERGECASALIVDGQPVLVDCGYGTLAALKKAGINHRQIAQVFLTHLHDDHTADLAAFLVRQWTDGRVQPTTVIGPYGTKKMVDAVVAFGEANAAIRTVDEARSVKPAEMIRARDVEATAAPIEIYKDDRLTVRAVENTHYPAESKQRMPYRSIALRFDTRGRSVVFSGDTAYSSGLVALADRADVLVCEAMDVAAMRKAFEGMVARGMYADNPEGVWRHIVSTHTPLDVAGRMAAEARVGTLVLTHIIPGALDTLPDATYVAAVRKTFSGTVIVGRDQMVL